MVGGPGLPGNTIEQQQQQQQQQTVSCQLGGLILITKWKLHHMYFVGHFNMVTEFISIKSSSMNCFPDNGRCMYLLMLLLYIKPPP